MCVLLVAAPCAPRRTDEVNLFERELKGAASAATASCSAWRCSTGIGYRATDAGRPTLSGALALLFDRAAALFGTKAAAAERHRATMRRCIVEILLSRSYVAPTSALTQNGERVPESGLLSSSHRDSRNRLANFDDAAPHRGSVPLGSGRFSAEQRGGAVKQQC